jgi:hypothetical protein
MTSNQTAIPKSEGNAREGKAKRHSKEGEERDTCMHAKEGGGQTWYKTTT